MNTITLPLALDSLSWLSDNAGVHVHLLRGGDDDDTRVMLLRVDPGVVIQRHHHTGEIHALGLAGTREILETGQRVGPGEYVYEPPGNIDSWRVIGDEPVLLFLTARGAIEYLGNANNIRRRSTTATVTAAFRALNQTEAVQ